MKAPSFAYARPAALADLFDLLERHGDGEHRQAAGEDSCGEPGHFGRAAPRAGQRSTRERIDDAQRAELREVAVR